MDRLLASEKSIIGSKTASVRPQITHSSGAERASTFPPHFDVGPMVPLWGTWEGSEASHYPLPVITTNRLC